MYVINLFTYEWFSFKPVVISVNQRFSKTFSQENIQINYSKHYKYSILFYLGNQFYFRIDFYFTFFHRTQKIWYTKILNISLTKKLFQYIKNINSKVNQSICQNCFFNKVNHLYGVYSNNLRNIIFDANDKYWSLLHIFNYI